MSGGCEKAIRDNAPHAEIAFDRFHVVRVGADAVDQARRDSHRSYCATRTVESTAI
jgi:transposase